MVISGTGDAFCAGDDVKEVAGLSLEAARTLSLRQANLFLAPRPYRHIHFAGLFLAVEVGICRLAVMN
ncbi:MAG: hypothetical protein WAL45_14540, partial [Terracidiphilus sp.]